ncbi:MAG: P27 family phage terminase small subunit [Rhodocyclaceae bacterium]|nr:P27 family phage terminase small subunit [Rhodocyclaceae bacterium]
MATGRRPKPTALKLVTGNAGRRPLNKNEPKPKGDLVDPPAWFDADHLAEWQFALKHAPLGLLKIIHTPALAAYCVAVVTLRRAILAQRDVEAQRAKDGLLPLVTKTPNGMHIQSPYVGIISKQTKLLISICAELGFTPSSLSRIELDPSDREEEDALDAAIGRK